MRKIIVLFLTAVACAQTASIPEGGSLDSGLGDRLGNTDHFAVPDPKKPVLMTWETWEKCYECPFRYLVGCVGDEDQCRDVNVPMKTVIHFGWFESEKEALAQAEVLQWNVTGLYLTVKADFQKVDEEKHEKQPDRVTTTHHYKTMEGVIFENKETKKGGAN